VWRGCMATGLLSPQGGSWIFTEPSSLHLTLLALDQILVIAVLMRSVMRRSFNIYQWCAMDTHSS